MYINLAFLHSMFCDWNSGLTNKTTRRKGTYEDEIDLFYDLGIKGIYLADANVGQYEEDIDMVAYLAKKNIEEGAEFRTDGNFSKLRKENNLKIYHLLARGNLITDNAGFIISVQDTNEDVLIKPHTSSASATASADARAGARTCMRAHA